MRRVSQEKARDLLSTQLEFINELRQYSVESAVFDKWLRMTKSNITNIFGEDSRQFRDFREISYTIRITTAATTNRDCQIKYLAGLDKAKAQLEALISEINTFWEAEEVAKDNDKPLEKLSLILSRFHSVAQQLRKRYGNRNPLSIEDEYDIQYLLHAILKVHFDDIRPEEQTHSYAGGSCRMDFLLKKEQFVLEVKKTRPTLGAKQIGDQLLIDIQRYKTHPDCRKLICFVYDPDGIIDNPVGLENDLQTNEGRMEVLVFIYPK